MPKFSAYTIIWCSEQNEYLIREPGSSDLRPVPDEEESWFAWLSVLSSCAFQGRQGHVTLRKESRASNKEGYWYAYRYLNRRTMKRYVGRTSDLTLSRLEAIAGEITAAFSAVQQQKEAPAFIPTLDSSFSVPPLLMSKMLLPRLQRSLIMRDRLLERLDACLEQKLTLLCAPAGFGKTTLARQWIAVRSEQKLLPNIAWVSLDIHDNDPMRFWRTLLTSVQHWYAVPDHHALNLLLASAQPSMKPLALESVLTVFLNEVVRQHMTGVLILDDYHLITEARIHETVSFFLSYLPETLHLVLITRYEPPLALAQLRANGELHELQTAELRFSSAECATFFQEFPLSAEVLERLDTQLEGWATGLRLFLLALQGNKTQAQVEYLLSTFKGSHRSLQDYFVGEVLEAQPEALQDFLLRTSVLPRLSPALCVAITDRQESAVFLEQIERHNLFLEALDDAGTWYRYHALFAEAMQHEARRRLGEAELYVLSNAASHWFERQGLLIEAIEAALKARENQRAANLLELFAQSTQMQANQEYHTLRRLLEQLPETILKQSSRLCFVYALALIFGRDERMPERLLVERLADVLQRAEDDWRAASQFAWLGELYAFRAFVALSQREYEQAAIWARQSLAWLPEQQVIWRNLSLNTLALLAFQQGQLNAAHDLFQQVHSLAQEKASTPILDITDLFLGVISFEQGRLYQAARYCRAFPDPLSQQEDRTASLLATLLDLLLLYEWNELDSLQQEIQKLLSWIAQLADARQQTFAYAAIEILQACLLQAQGQTDLAVQRLETLLKKRHPPADAFSLLLDQEALYWLVHLLLSRGDQFGAQYWLNELTWRHQHYGSSLAAVAQLLPASIGQLSEHEQADNLFTTRNNAHIPALIQEQTSMLTARLALYQHQPEVSLKLLGALLPEARAEGRNHHLLQITLLMAQAYAISKQTTLAHQYLLEALELGYAGGYLRSFLDERERLIPLLHALLPDLPSEPLASYAQRILRYTMQKSPVWTRNATDLTILVNQLTAQERRVLRFLASGCSVPEIARELVVSVNTIRTQVQSIYRKLNVHDRDAAREIARQLHLG